MTSTHDKPGFTEGPWTYYVRSEHHPRGKPGTPTDIAQHEEGVETESTVELVSFTEDHFELPLAEQLANARLIAQAPEMFRLLETILSTLSTLEVRGDGAKVLALELQGAEASKLLREVRGE